jgi:hypothetical protein
MSTLGEVVTKSADMAEQFRKLLATETAKAAPEIARDLGTEAQFAQAVTSASHAVVQVGDWIGEAHEAVTIADAAVAAFALLPGLARGLEQAIGSASEQVSLLAGAGLDLTGAQRGIGEGLAPVRSAVLAGLGRAGSGADAVADSLEDAFARIEDTLAYVDPASLGALQAKVRALGEQIATLARPPAKA